MLRCVDEFEVGWACGAGTRRWIGGRRETKRGEDGGGEGKRCGMGIENLLIRDYYTWCECAGGIRGLENGTRAWLELHGEKS